MSFLGEAELLQPAQVRVLKRLHTYRNEAYREDRLRSRTLDSALRIYILVICDLLQNFQRAGNYPETTRYIYVLAAVQLARYLGEYCPDPEAAAAADDPVEVSRGQPT